MKEDHGQVYLLKLLLKALCILHSFYFIAIVE